MTDYERQKRHREAQRARLAEAEAEVAKLRELLRIALAALECASAAQRHSGQFEDNSRETHKATYR